MDVERYLLIALAGAGAGFVNTVVGSGTLITFPTLLALGYSPLVANVSNTLGLVPGSASGAYGYRKELKGQRERGVKLSLVALLGGTAGAVLLVLRPGIFQQIVPYLVLTAVALMVLQPKLTRYVAAKDSGRLSGGILYPGVFLTAVYGGYFGAAQGVILIAVLAIGIDESLQRLNGLKNVLAGVVNAVAAVVFIFITHIAYGPVITIALSSIVGAQVGAKVGRKIPSKVLRSVVVVVGLIVAVKLILN
jgi:uncharacterized membrane protein YfcA